MKVSIKFLKLIADAIWVVSLIFTIFYGFYTEALATPLTEYEYLMPKFWYLKNLYLVNRMDLALIMFLSTMLGMALENLLNSILKWRKRNE